MSEKEKCEDLEDAQINAAIALRHQGEDEKALEILLAVNARCGGIPVVCLFIGEILVRQGKIDAALPYLQECVFLRPDLKVASLCLYRAFGKVEMNNEAFLEAARFDSQNQDPVYVELLSALDEGDFELYGLSKETILAIETQVAKYPSGYKYPWHEDFNGRSSGPTGNE
jgi:hypothetical protein